MPNVAQSFYDERSPSQQDALSDCERWYAVHTLPFAEARSEGQLHRQGFRTFQPKRHKTVRHARRLSTVEAPFFPRYLFIVLDLARHQWRSVNGTFGVSRLVMWGEQPHPVPSELVLLHVRGSMMTTTRQSLQVISSIRGSSATSSRTKC
jgi:transcription antitermination factor NusG